MVLVRLYQVEVCEIPQSFLRGLDCILSDIRLIRPSFITNARSVVESLPYPIKADEGSNPADYPISNVITRERSLPVVPRYVSIFRW